MKKVILIVVVVILLGLLFPIGNLFVGQPKDTAATKKQYGDPRVAQLARLLEPSCADCHVEGLKPPFYAVFPIASSLVSRDKKEGLKWFDMAEELETEPGLAKVERTLLQGSMPPKPYLLLHWKAVMSSKEKEAVLGLIKEVRVASFAPKGLPREVAEATVHPLPERLEVNEAQAAIGRKLYHDKRLSGDNTVSCASCHALDKGGTDQARVSTGIKGQLGPINAPTTFNAVFHIAQFWDGRAKDLQEQAAGPVENPIEMGAKFEDVIAKLMADEAFMAEFLQAYPQGLSKETITHAIAEFEKTLITPGSPFDRYLLGEREALDEQARRGFEIFRREGCDTCHVGKALGGQSFELMGRAKDYFAARGTPVTEADLGRYNVTKRERDRHRFKVPSLRNIALTPPYFHDGSASTLEEAVQKMAEFQIGRGLPKEDLAAVVAFLKSLTGTLFGKPL